jgi:hypothetical protein
MPNIEELTQRAIQEGKFSDLPGKGKPLRLDENPHSSITGPQAEFLRALRVFAENIAQINQRIFDYNLQTPTDRFQLLKLNLEQEIEQFCLPPGIDHSPAL